MTFDKKSYEKELDDFNLVYKSLKANCPSPELAYFLAGLHQRVLDVEQKIQKLEEIKSHRKDN